MGCPDPFPNLFDYEYWNVIEPFGDCVARKRAIGLAELAGCEACRPTKREIAEKGAGTRSGYPSFVSR